MHDLAAHMSPDDLRLRFFLPLRGLSHQLAARLTQVDYGHAMALLAMHADTLLGVARYAAEADRREAEFAIAVRSDWHHRGVGHLLLTRLIEIAWKSGITELFGVVPRENTPMIDICRELGFRVESHPQDAALMRARKALGTSGADANRAP